MPWCNTLLLIWSEAASKSRWVELEWTNAVALEKLIIPCILDTISLPAILASTLFLDFHDKQQGLAELVHALGLKAVDEPKIAHPQADRIAEAVQESLRTSPKFSVIKPPHSEPVLTLRTIQKSELYEDEVASMLREYDFYVRAVRSERCRFLNELRLRMKIDQSELTSQSDGSMVKETNMPEQVARYGIFREENLCSVAEMRHNFYFQLMSIR